MESTKPATASVTTQSNPSNGEDADLQRLFESRRKELGISERQTKPIARALKAIPPALSDEEIARRRAADEEQERFRREAQRRERWEKFAAARGKRYRDCRLSNYVVECDGQREAIRLLTEYAKDIAGRIEQGQGIVLTGPCGTGKDHFMVAMIREAIGADKSVIWKDGVSLFREFRGVIGDDRASEGDIIWPLVQCDVLAISDPLPVTGSLTPYQANTLREIVGRRYDHSKAVWITMNGGSRLEAEERMAAATVDRLGHGALTIVCDWPSWRQKTTTTK